MRITGGIARSLTLKSPTGGFIRPSADALRESLFSSLGETVKGQTFLDLFAGTGAYGLEALSRGASGGIFVEKDRRAMKCLRMNMENVSKAMGACKTPCEAFLADVLKWRPAREKQFGIIFADPPYRDLEKISSRLFALLSRWIARDGLVIHEMPAELNLQFSGWNEMRQLGKSGRGRPNLRLFRQA